MAELKTYFDDFLASIRLTQEQIAELKEVHTTLRERLEKDETLSKILVATFLQGSYRRGTIIRPRKDKRADVDVIVVTNLDRFRCTPHQAQAQFQPFLEKHYSGKHCPQGRSIGIELRTVDLDLVITSAPSEVDQKALRFESVRSSASLEEAPDLRFNSFWIAPERRGLLEAPSWMRKAANEPEWQTEPLWIPDRDLREWQQAHPLAQIRQTRDKNARTGGNYINVVKALKWWRRVSDPEAEHPKSYPLERIFFECCPDQIDSVAQGVVGTLEQIITLFRSYAAAGRVPVLCDHGISQDVLKRLVPEDFLRFYEQARKAAPIARDAYEEADRAVSANKWRGLLGTEFPPPPEGDRGSGGSSSGGAAAGGYSERRNASTIGSGRFA